MNFPFHGLPPLTYGDDLPSAADVVVVGGGIIGVMTAWHLAERGFSVVLCEKGRVAGEQSSRNWGWIRQQGRDFAELPIMMESLALWKAMAEEIPELGFRQQGVMYLARSHDEMFRFEQWMTEARGMGLDVRLQSEAQIYGRYDRAAVQWVGGLFTESDAMAEPWVAVPLLAEAAVERGAVVIEDCAVRRLDRAGGRVTGVYTEKGRIACDQVVVAGGAWSSLLLRAEGISLPQLSVLASVAQTEPMAQAFDGCIGDDRVGLRRRADGGYTIAPGARHTYFVGPDAFRNLAHYVPVLKREYRSTKLRPAAPKDYPDAWGTARRWSGEDVSPFERMRVLNPSPDMKLLGQVQDEFAEAFPELGRPAIRSAWAGMIDTIPDVVPVVDRVAALPGLVIATGMCGHGFGIGPGMGRVVADLVAGNDVGHDLTRFRLSRFTDGSVLVPGPSL
ncbi:MAG: FAD-binding oxidoreductase [Pseudorhodobacter sp.]|nr:FAD-binding oxidoreductase [Pseudorhodobacter sp.]